jgi:hypothetical protein
MEIVETHSQHASKVTPEMSFNSLEPKTWLAKVWHSGFERDCPSKAARRMKGTGGNIDDIELKNIER